MDSTNTAGGRRAGAWRATALLVAGLFLLNGAAIWGILSARESAEREALRDLGLRTAAQARAVEAALASLRGDLIFLSQAPGLVDAGEAMRSDDPLVRRWGRLGAEGSLLLFLESHDAVERAEALDAGGGVLVAVSRREGAPVVLPPAEGSAPGTAELLATEWPLGPPEAAVGRLTAWIDPEHLVAAAVPGVRVDLAGAVGPEAGSAVPAQGADLVVRPLSAAESATTAATAAAAPGAEADGEGFTVDRRDGVPGIDTQVVAEGWDPPVRWRLERRVRPRELLGSFDVLARRYRATVLLNLAIVTLALGLGWLTLRQVRRSARLAAANEQQARVRELERQVMHSERLASVGRLAAGLAHEINNPLEGMANYLALLEDDLRHAETDDALAAAGRVREGLERIAGITRRVLALAEPGRAPKRRLDLAAAVAETVEFVRGNRAFDGVAVELERPVGEVPVRGNPATLGQLFLNLLLNAREVQPEGGRVEVRVRVQRPAAGVATAVVEVADRGPGIAEDDLPRLFEPFFSTRGSTGLGLSMCHAVAEEHGGELIAANRPGGGARFTLRLPLAADRAEPGAMPQPAADETGLRPALAQRAASRLPRAARSAAGVPAAALPARRFLHEL